MACLVTNPAFQEFFARLGLRKAGDFLDLPGIIVSGHSNRNVARVQLQCGCEKVTAFLKREHRALRRQRFSNSLKGFGYVSNSMREAATLNALTQTGIGCPAVLAAGEDDRGRAFLLIQELTGFMELRRSCKNGSRIRKPGDVSHERWESGWPKSTTWGSIIPIFTPSMC